MRRIILSILLFSSFIAKGQIYQKISTWEEYLNRMRVTGMFRPPLTSISTPDTGSIYYRASDSTYLGWSGNAYRPIGSGSGNGGLFGITDTTTSVDRYVNLQNHDLTIDSASQLQFNGQAGGIGGSLTLGNIARLYSYDNTLVHSIALYPNYIAINGPTSTDPPKIWIQASDSLHTSTPSSIMAFENDTVKNISIADLSALVGGVPDTTSGNGLSTKYYTNNPTRWPAEEPIGLIYSRNDWTNAITDFLPNPSGGASLALNGEYVDYTVSSISWGNYTTILPLRATILPNWTISVTFKQITAPASGTVGFGLGTHKAIGGNGDVLCYINTTNSGSSGTLAINRGDGASTWQTGSSFTVNQNDIIKLTVTFVDSSITFSANNLTTGGSGSINYTNTLVSAASPISLISNWALIGHSSTSCTWQVQDITITSQTKRNANLVVMGDSKTQGAFADYFATRFGTRLNSSYPASFIYASGNAKISDFLNLCQDEIGSLNGRQYLLSLGSNDKRGGATLVQMEDNYSKLVKLLEGGGAKVYHIVMPEDSTSAGVGLRDFERWVATTYPNNYIDVWTQLSTGNVLKAGYNSGDGVHPNEAANKSIDSLVVLSGKITTNPTNRRQSYRVGGGLIELFGDSIATRPFDKGLNRVNHWDATAASRTGLLQDDGTTAGVSSALLTPITGSQFNVTGFLGINGANSGLILANRGGSLTTGRYTIYAESDRLNMYDLSAASTRWSLFSNGNILIGSTTDGGQKLQVNGDAAVAGYISGITSLRSIGTGASVTAGAGAGSLTTLSVSGGDAAGKIDCTVGTSPSASATIGTITFNAAYASAPIVILTPGNAAAAALSGNGQVYVSSISATGFVVSVGSTALSTSVQYIWYYHVIQ